MTTLRSLIARNCKVFFKDKGVLLPSLLAPLILLFLFIAFLGNIYRESVRSATAGFTLSDGLVESIAAGWLLSSLLAVCAVTIAFSSNIIMVQDRAMGQTSDFFVSPVSRSVVALSYFISTFLVTTAICSIALVGGLIYIAVAGWHLSVLDLLQTIADTVILTLFGTSLSSIVCFFLKSQGGVAAVQATVSAAYGFLCGAYMPVSNLTAWLRNAVMFLPGTYGTGLLHLHLMGGAIDAVVSEGLPVQLADGLKEGFDCTLKFFGTQVPEWTSYLILIAATLLLMGVYVLLCSAKKRHKKNPS